MYYTISNQHFAELRNYLYNHFDHIEMIGNSLLCQSVEMALGDSYITDIYIQVFKTPECVDLNVMFGDVCYRTMFENILAEIEEKLPESKAITLGELLEEAMS